MGNELALNLVIGMMSSGVIFLIVLYSYILYPETKPLPKVEIDYVVYSRTAPSFYGLCGIKKEEVKITGEELGGLDPCAIAERMPEATLEYIQYKESK